MTRKRSQKKYDFSLVHSGGVKTKTKALHDLSRSLLTIPPTSVEAERTFSASGLFFYQTKVQVAGHFIRYAHILIFIFPLWDRMPSPRCLLPIRENGRLGLASIRPLYGLYTASIWPLYGLYTAFIRPLYGLYTAFIRPLYGLYTAFIRPLYGLYTATIRPL